MSLQETMSQIPDSAKIAIATSSSALSFLGVPVEQWMYLLSAIVSVLFILEKLPVVIKMFKEMYVKWKE